MPFSGKDRPENQRIGDGTAPMEEQWGTEMQEEAGARPWRGLGFKQGDDLAVQWLPVAIPQGFQTQKKHQPLRVFMKDLKEAVKQLVRDAGFFLCAKG